MDKTISETEQWLLDGDCDKCRREKFCSKPCKRGQMRQRAYIAGAVMKAFAKSIAASCAGEEADSGET